MGKIDSNGLTYETDIDYERLAKMTPTEVFKYAEEEFNVSDKTSAEFQSMCRTMLSVCKCLKLTPDNEQLLFVLSNVKRTLCESIAGSGKTTMSQLCVLKYKLVDRMDWQDILCLAYNTNAVDDMVERHAELAQVMNTVLKKTHAKQIAAGVAAKPWSEIAIATELKCKTFHSLAREWVLTYKTKFGIRDEKNFLMSEEQATDYMSQAFNYYMKTAKQGIDLYITHDTVAELMSLYSFAKGTLTMDNSSEWNISFSEKSLGGLSFKDAQDIFALFTKMKKAKGRMDYNDLIDSLYTLTCDPVICQRIRDNYKVILVDEYQDITPDMLRVLKMIAEGNGSTIERYDDLRLICVGDTDQAIYGFRGTDPFNCARFARDYKKDGVNDVKILSMSVNRRCASEILVFARKLIELNEERIRKPISGIREGGFVKFVGYESEMEQMEKILAIIKSIPINERGDTCICFRNNSSSNLLGIRLFEAHLPFHSLSGKNNLFSDKISILANATFTLFGFPSSQTHMEYVLQHLLPKTKKFTKAMLGDMISKSRDKNFWELDWSTVRSESPSVSAALDVIIVAYKKYKQGAKLSMFMPSIFQLYRAKDYYYNRNLTEQDKLFLEFMQAWYTDDKRLGEVRSLVNSTSDDFKSALEAGTSIALSSFHGLKGLEFKHVIIMDLHESLFPDMEIKRNPNASAKQKKLIYAEATRLLYVAMTRAKDALYMIHSEKMCTQFVTKIKGDKITTTYNFVTDIQKEEIDTNDGGFILNPIDVRTLEVEGFDPTQLESLEEEEIIQNVVPGADMDTKDFDAATNLPEILDEETGEFGEAEGDTGAVVARDADFNMGSGITKQSLSEQTLQKMETATSLTDKLADILSPELKKEIIDSPKTTAAVSALVRSLANRTGGSIDGS